MEPHTTPQATLQKAALPRVLNYWDAAALAVGIIIGSGIFAVPPSIAGHLDTFGSMILIWILGGVLALAGALAYAELSTMFPRTGGAFVFMHETYGPFMSFTYGWSALLITYPASLAAIAMVFSRYLSRLIALSPTGEAIVAALLCILLAGINGLGAKVGAGIQRTLTAAKVAALAAIPVCGFLLARGDISRLTEGGLAPSGGWTLSGWAFALAAVMWTFEGWADTPTIAGEVKDKKRDIPRGLIIAAVSITFIYVAANAAYVYLLGTEGVAASTSVATDAASAIFGGGGALFVTLLVLVSTAGSINGSMIGGSRVFFAMASEGLFFKSVARVHPRFGTPLNSLLLLGLISAAYCLMGSFERLMNYFVFIATIWFALNILAVIVLRVRRPDLARPFKVPLYPLTPLVFLGVILSLGTQLFLDNTGDALAGIGLICLSIPGYILWKRSHRSLSP